MEKVKAGIIGAGYIGGSHIEAIRRICFAELVAVADTNRELAKSKAEEYFIPRCYNTVEELLQDDEIKVVHNCTPNHLHLDINQRIIKAGKHVFSEKPLGKTCDESAAMLELLDKYPNIIHGVNFNYRMNPLVQEMKQKVKKGEIGIPRLIFGSYLQDWLLFDTDYNWRLEPEICGPSRAVADIGSHWMDAAQVITESKIVEVCANLVTVLPKRKKPKTQVATFAVNSNTEFEEKEINTEDYAAVMFRMDNGINGVFHVSQVSAGRKCYLNIEVSGSKASLYWNQENADQMWMGFRDKDNSQIFRNPILLNQEVNRYTYLAAGHPEGWNDALKNNIYSFYSFIAQRKNMKRDHCDFASFEDGHYIMKTTDAILRSNAQKQWVKVEEGNQ